MIANNHVKISNKKKLGVMIYMTFLKSNMLPANKTKLWKQKILISLIVLTLEIS